MERHETTSNGNVTEQSFADNVLEVACATDATADLLRSFQETETDLIASNMVHLETSALV